MGTYPTAPKLTQKGQGNTPQYLIPDNYIVETEVAKWNVRCETKYISNLKVCYTVSWKEGHRDWSVNSIKSSTSAINIFLQVYIEEFTFRVCDFCKINKKVKNIFIYYGN